MRSSRLVLAGTAASMLLAVPHAGHAASVARAGERTFDFTYRTTINNIPEGAKKVAVWLPYPVSDTNQEISDVRVQSTYPTTLHKDSLYGNTILYLDVENPAVRSIPIEIDFRVKRREYVHRDFGAAAPAAASMAEPAGDGPALMERWLQPDKLVPIDGRIRKLALEVTAGKATDLDRARAIYEYAVTTMKYDKSGTGWGRGDIYYACDVKKGNCTDFHALFIGLARAVGIPAKFAIGFPLPAGKPEGEIGGYHCWAEFHLKGYGWVPVDASEASKNPDRKEYFFGAHDENRVQLTIGRDIRLEPPQSGDPMNYFIYPYVEVDGKTFTDVERKFSFKDGATGGASGQ